MKLISESGAQPWIDGEEIVATKRIASIVFSADGNSVMLFENLDPKIDMLACPNWNLRGKENSPEILIQLLFERSGYNSIKFVEVLEGEIHRKFRKIKDGGVNEEATYQGSVYLVQLENMEKDDPEDKTHLIHWKKVDEMDDFFAKDGSHGSSFMLWELYRHYYPKQ